MRVTASLRAMHYSLFQEPVHNFQMIVSSSSSSIILLQTSA